MSQMQTNANTELAKDYITKRKIPQLFEALITGLMVNKPDDHIEFIVDSLSRFKTSNQPLKWDAFIARKGGLKNNLAPLKTTTQANEPLNLDFNQKPKLDAIPAGKHDEKRSQSPVQRPQSPPAERQQSPPAERQQPPSVERPQSPSTERPQSPTPEQQQQRQTEDQQRVDKEENQVKESLKGKPIIFVGGGPGSGKGTQCEKMIEKYGFTHLSAGDLIRAAAQDSTTEKGRYFNEVMSQGKLISTEDILGLLKDAIYEKASSASGFLIDGFPRRVDQGIQFEREVVPCDVLIYFDVPDEIMTERLIKRGETSGRIDDNEETIRKRLDTFHEQTTPILGYYGKQGKLVTIDANRQPDEVFNDVVQALEGLIDQKQVGKLNEYIFEIIL